MSTFERGRRPLSQVDVERMIAADIEMLEEATDDYEKSLISEAKADAKFKRSWNRTFLAASGAKYIKEAQAHDQCADEYEEMLIAAAEAKALREHMWTIRTRLDSLRSLNANVRAQV